MDEVIKDIESTEVPMEKVEETQEEVNEEAPTEEAAPQLLNKEELDHLANTARILFIIDCVVSGLALLFFLIPLILPVGKSISSLVPVIFAIGGLVLTLILRNFNAKLKLQKDELEQKQRSFLMTTTYFVTAFLVVNIVVAGVILAIPVGTLIINLVGLVLGGVGTLFTAVATLIAGIITVTILLFLAVIGVIIAAVVAFFVFILPKISAAGTAALLLL